MTTMPDGNRHTPDIERELALPSRIGHTALLLVALAGASVVGALLVTEAGLPMRTRLAFVGLLVITLAWSAFALWVLTQRRVLFARHRVIAGWMGVVFSTLFAVASLVIGPQVTTDSGYLWAVATGTIMLLAAAGVLVRGRRRVAQLASRKAELEARLGIASQ